MEQKIKDCKTNCRNSYEVCIETLNYCLEKGGDHANPEHIKLLMDCAEICKTSENFLIRQSDNHTITCGACAEICRACSESCEEFDDDEQLIKCAEICNKCAESCEAMTD